MQNKYSKYYYSIINNSKSRELSIDSYREKHHIIPKSLGGNNSNDNLAVLTAREHFVCHLLLTKMTLGENKAKMVFAAMRLLRSKNNALRGRISSRSYEKLKLAWSESQKLMWANPIYRQNQQEKHKKLWTEERRSQASKKAKEVWANQSLRNEASDRGKARWSDDKLRQQQSELQKQLHIDNPNLGSKKSLPGELNGMYGKKHSNESKLLMAEIPLIHLAGKTYEEIYGEERAIEIKAQRSVQLKKYLAENPNARTGKKNPNAKTYKFTSPTGEVFVITGGMIAFCKEHSLSVDGIIDVAKNRKPLYKGWFVEYVDLCVNRRKARRKRAFMIA